jgi:hypothetical protein
LHRAHPLSPSHAVHRQREVVELLLTREDPPLATGSSAPSANPSDGLVAIDSGAGNGRTILVRTGAAELRWSQGERGELRRRRALLLKAASGSQPSISRVLDYDKVLRLREKVGRLQQQLSEVRTSPGCVTSGVHCVCVALGRRARGAAAVHGGPLPG